MHGTSKMCVGHMSYVSEPLRLGDLKANKFSIVLKDLTFRQLKDTNSATDKATTATGTAAADGDAAMDTASEVRLVICEVYKSISSASGSIPI